jgi:hypothetical protein
LFWSRRRMQHSGPILDPATFSLIGPKFLG